MKQAAHNVGQVSNLPKRRQIQNLPHEKRRSRITVRIHNRQEHIVLDRRVLRRAVGNALRGAGIRRATISVAVVDDETTAQINWRYLRHRGPADVLSFPLDESDGLEGEVIVSAETALRAAPAYGWPPQDELLLYLIHGTLHLAGYDDRTSRQRADMQQREREVLEEFGITRR